MKNESRKMNPEKSMSISEVLIKTLKENSRLQKITVASNRTYMIAVVCCSVVFLVTAMLLITKG